METYLDMPDVFERMPVLICAADPADGRIIYMNRMARELFPNAGFLDETPLAFEPRPGFSAEPQPAGRAAARRGDDGQTDLEYSRSINGRLFRITRYPSKWERGRRALLFCGLDRTEIKASEQLMTQSMYIDAMTGIYNRRFAADILNRYASELGRGGDFFSVCCLDLNGLKYVNDTFGHAEGDRYIMEVVSVVKSAVRETDVFARIGGDEFLILFPQCPREAAAGIMESAGRRLAEIGAACDGGVRYSISYGVIEAREIAGGVEDAVADIMKAVDAKMYEMKEKYRRSNDKGSSGA